MSNIAQRLKELRRERALTQREFATIFNVNHSTLAMWETGKNQPDIETLKKLALFFQTTIDDLVGNSDEWGNTAAPVRHELALNEKEKEVISLYRQLSQREQDKITTALEVYADAAQAEKQQKKGG